MKLSNNTNFTREGDRWLVETPVSSDFYNSKSKIKNQKWYNLSILDRYIINEIISFFIFSVTICSLTGELIGISFEQVRFMLERDLPLETSIYIHWLKLPSFIAIAMPFAILMSAILAYERLAINNEIIAFQSFGINLYRLLIPALAIGLLLTFITFFVNEAIVPRANYQAAIILEKAVNVDRDLLAKYQKKDIIYREFDDSKQHNLKLLLFADKFTNNQLYNITAIGFEQGKIAQITIAEIAQWKSSKKAWNFQHGQISFVNQNGAYGRQIKFEQIFLNLPKTISDYAKHDLDAREMNIWQLQQRLGVIEKIGDYKEIRKLQIAIQERLANPFSCIIFAFLGTSIGIKSKNKSGNGFGITIMTIFSYYLLTFITVTLAYGAVLPIVLGVWFPNFLLLGVSGYLLNHKLARI